ncbi:MAG: YkvA family protein [Thermoleophilaceae bacterium]
MDVWQGILIGLGAALLVYTLFVGWLIVAGRKEEARAVAGLVPDFVVLFRRLLSDGRVSRRRKFVLAALIPYLAMPFDLVPDFIPVAGYLDDAVIVAFALRYVLRGSGPELIEEHWPGPRSSLALVLRLAGYRRATTFTPEPPPA